MKNFCLIFVLVLAGLRCGLSQTVELYPVASTPDFPHISTPFSIEIDVHNDGPVGTMADNVVVTNVIPPQWTIVSYSVATYVRLPWLYDGSLQYFAVSATNYGNTVVFNAGKIPNGFWRPMWVTLIPNQTGTFNSPIQVTSPQNDTVPSNNSINYSVLVHSNSLFVAGEQTVAENSGSNAVFTVTLSPPSTNTVTVEYRTLDGTARAGQDYQFTTGMLTFPPGVTNQPVSVPVLDDSLIEDSPEWFSIALTNPVNAEISGQSGFNYVTDNEAPLLVSVSNAAPVVEGDLSTNLSFPLTLSGPCDRDITVSFTTAQAVVSSGTLLIHAGDVSTNLSVSVIGDLTVQSNRDVLLTLTGVTPYGSISSSSNAIGTIVEDDGQPGKFDHMLISTLPSPQLVGRPFPVTISTKDYFNDPATNFFGPVELYAYYISNFQSHVVQTFHVTDFTNGNATVMVTYSNAYTNVLLTVWKPVGQTWIATTTPSLKIISSPPLIVSLPAVAVEGDGLLPGAGRVSLTNADNQDITIQLNPGTTQKLVVPASVFISAGQTSAVFDVTIVDDTLLDGTRSPSVTANSPGYATGSAAMTVYDNESATLGLSLPTGLSEAKGFNSGNAVLTCSTAPTQPIMVSISSSDTTELTAPCCVYIQPGQTSAVFTVSVPDDTYVDGPQIVSLTARFTNWVSAVASTTVADNDNVVGFGFDQGGSLAEGAGTLTNRITVRTGGTVSNDVVIQLTSNRPDKLAVPPTVTIVAGTSQVVTNLFVPDDALFDGSQVVTLTASAAGFTNGSTTYTVLDNDVALFTFGTISGSRTSGVPFGISFNAKDTNGVMIASYAGATTLQLLVNGSLQPLSPNVVSNFIRGGWSGNVTAAGWGTNVQILVTATNGTTAMSAPFNIVAPAWAANVQITRFEIDATGAHVYFNSFTGHTYQVESKASLNSISWQPAGTGQAGTGAEMSATIPAGTDSAFYRLSVSP